MLNLGQNRKKIALSGIAREKFILLPPTEGKVFQNSSSPLCLSLKTMIWWLLTQESQKGWGFKHGPEATLKVWLQAGPPPQWESTAPGPRAAQGMSLQSQNSRMLRRHQGLPIRLAPTGVSGQAWTRFLVGAPTPTIPWGMVCWVRDSSQEYGGAPGRT